jgi:hypothetical protein
MRLRLMVFDASTFGASTASTTTTSPTASTAAVRSRAAVAYECVTVRLPSVRSAKGAKLAVSHPLKLGNLMKFRAARGPPLASTGVSTSESGPGAGHDDEPIDDPTAGGVSSDDRARAGAALRDSFARLSPQGSDEWNFLGAFTHLGDRYGPYQPGASDLADLLRSKTGSATRRGRRSRSSSGVEDGRSEVEDAMTHVVEAFRFLHARVSTLEERLTREDVPLDGAAWLAPARELDGWIEPLVTLLRARVHEGEVLHADCGEGALIRALMQESVAAAGVEPRGGVALQALERGCDVAISEVGEHLPQRSTASLGGLVLSGVVDRLPLHAILPLLADSRRALARGAPIVIVSEPLAPLSADAPTSHDMVDGAALHLETWELLLDRSGFIDVTPFPVGTGGDERFGISATSPTT